MTRLVFTPLLCLAIALAFMTLPAAARAADAKPGAASADRYPPAAAKGLYDGCMKSKDLPADLAKGVCACYAGLMQIDVPYSVFAKTSAEIKAKGFKGLDAEGKEAIEKNGYIADYCRLRNGAAGTAQERGTFPESAMPALHASCMAFKDVAPDQREKFCGCYESLVRTRITYSDWRQLSLAIAVKGAGHLDPNEENIFGVIRSARLACGGAPK